MIEENKVDEVLTIQQRMRKARQLKRLAPRLARFRKIRKKRLADTDRLKKRSRKAARKLLRKKVAGKRGENFASLSPSGKIAVDKLVAKRGRAAIEKLAKRLLPKVRKAEIARVARARKNNEEAILEAKKKKKIKKTKKKSYEEFMRETKTDGPAVKSAKKQVKREKKTDNIKHDRMLDRARLTDARNKNRKTTPNKGVRVTVNAKESLYKKATEAGISYEMVKEQYDIGYSEANVLKRLTREQQAFARVNTFIANLKSNDNG